MTENFSKIEIDVSRTPSIATPYAGLFPFIKMCEAMNLPYVINSNVRLRTEKGYKDSDHVLSLITMQIVGGITLDDLSLFKEKFNLPNCPFNIPSPSAERNFMNSFRNIEEEPKQKQGYAHIPKENEHLAGFQNIHAHIFQCAYNAAPKKVITLDQDATFIYTHNKNALYNYQGEKSYEAFNTYCPEYDVVLGTQYRDGNVPAGYGQLDELKRVLSLLPVGVEKVQLRSDSAGYQEEIMKYCMDSEKGRVGVINFTISCDVGKSFKAAAKAVPEGDWHPVEREVVSDGKTVKEATGQEWADVSYVPVWAGGVSKNAPEYRFIAIRERFEDKDGDETKPQQLIIPEIIEDLEAKNEEMKALHLVDMVGQVHKVFGIVTNMLEKDGSQVVLWHHGRCGKSEELHLVLKEELAGGHIVSGKFGANAAYWNIAVAAFSLLNLFKRKFMPEECVRSRPKTLRYKFFTMIGRMVSHGGKTVFRVFAGKAAEWYMYARDRLMSCSELAV
jgi:hypothetical protein